MANLFIIDFDWTCEFVHKKVLMLAQSVPLKLRMRSKYFWWAHLQREWIYIYIWLLQMQLWRSQWELSCMCECVNVIEFRTQQENYPATENGIFDRISSSRKYNSLLLHCTVAHTEWTLTLHMASVNKWGLKHDCNLLTAVHQLCMRFTLGNTKLTLLQQETRCRQFTVIPFWIYIQF